MPQHCKNAQAVAEYLAQNDKVAWVNYCGLPGDKYYEQAQKYMPNGSCGVVTFGLKGGREESIKFMDSLKLAAIVTHVADARTCVLHPASHTHRQLTDEQLMEAGVRPDLIRFSVGSGYHGNARRSPGSRPCAETPLKPGPAPERTDEHRDSPPDGVRGEHSQPKE